MLPSTAGSMLETASICVLGLGNILYGDEGAGIHALREVAAAVDAQVADAQVADAQAVDAQAAIDWVDGGVLGLNLLPLVETSPALLILDCIDNGLPPGTVIEMTGGEIPMFSGQKLSEHQLSFQEVLALARVRNTLPPRLHLIGVQPESFALGLELSPVVQAAMPEVVRRAIRVLQTWKEN